MRHSDKKFLKVHKVSQEVANLIQSRPTDNEAISQLAQKGFDTHYPVMITAGNKMIQAFFYKEGSKIYMIPEPNPVIMYFESARFYAKHAQESKQILLEKLESSDQNIYKLYDLFHTFYTNATISATFLFISIETFINGLIPFDFLYEVVSDKKTEMYNQFQVQKHIQFEEKVKKVVPKAKGVVFHQKQSHFEKALKHTKDYINYHESDLIEELDRDEE